jgi:hypothetical protein
MAKNKNKKNTPTEAPTPEVPAVETTPEVNMEEFAKNVLAPTLPEYKVIYNANHFVLEKEITDYLNDGWKLVGGVAMGTYTSPYENFLYFSQAIAKNI